MKSLPFQLPVVDIFRIIHCNTIPAAGIPQWKMQKIKKKHEFMEK